jgi:Domain of unknown function (DUF5668)
MTVDEPRVRITPNLAYGICLVLIGSTLVLDRLELIEASQILRYWPVGLVLIGLALVIQSFQPVDTAQTARAGDAFNAGHLVVWVIVALIASQAFSRGGVFWRGDVATRTESSDTASILAIWGRHQLVVNAPVFRGGDLTSVMGRSELDLRSTTIGQGGETAIDVFTLMGGSTVRVPDGWIVDLRAVPLLGAVRDRRTGARNVEGSPRIVIRGFIMLGGLDIRS